MEYLGRTNNALEIVHFRVMDYIKSYYRNNNKEIQIKHCFTSYRPKEKQVVVTFKMDYKYHPIDVDLIDYLNNIEYGENYKCQEFITAVESVYEDYDGDDDEGRSIERKIYSLDVRIDNFRK